MENKKYELVKDDSIKVDGRTLYRIKALKDFNDVHKDDLGGYIESYKNLEQEGNCWIYDNACVYDNAKVYDDVKVIGEAHVFDNAKLFDNAYISGHANIFEKAEVDGKSHVFDNACVYGCACVENNSYVYGNAQVYGYAQICGCSSIFDNAKVCGFVYSARVFENATVGEHVIIVNGSNIRSNAVIKNEEDYILFHTGWFDKYDSFITYTKSNNMWANDNYCQKADEWINILKQKQFDYDEVEFKKMLKNYKKLFNFVKDAFD